MAAPVLTGSSSNARSSGAVTSLTWSHTSNGDPLFVLTAMTNAGVGDVTGVTFNGVALRRGGMLLDGTTARYTWWHLQSPGTATANVVVSLTSSYIAAGAHNVQNARLDLEGASGFAHTSGNSTTPSKTIDSATNSLVIDLVISNVANQTFTQGAGQTLVFSQVDATTNQKGATSTEAGAASVVMSWTLGTSGTWWMVGLSIDDQATTVNSRLSQIVAEVATEGTSVNRLSQVVAEVATEGASVNRLSQIVAEVATEGASFNRLSQIVAEVAYHSNYGGVMLPLIDVYGEGVPLTPGVRVEVGDTMLTTEPVVVLAGTYSLTDIAGSGKRLSCDVYSEDGSVRPTEGQFVRVWENDGDVEYQVFAGIIVTPRERGVVGPFAPIATEIICAGFAVFTEEAIVKFTVETDDLINHLTTLAALLGGGVTVSGDQDAGPEMPGGTYRFVTAKSVLDQWAKATGRTWKIDDSGDAPELLMYAPSTIVAPHNISDNGTDIVGDMEVEPSGASEYCNRLILVCGDGTALEAVAESITQIGAEVEYEMEYLVSENIEDQWPNVIYINGSGVVVSWGQDAPTFQWWWDYNNSKLMNDGAALTPGDEITFTYSPSSTQVFDDLAEQASYGRRVDGTALAPNVETVAAAAMLGAAILAERIIRPVKVTYPTRLVGLSSGTVQTIEVPIRNVDGTFQIASVTHRDDVDGVIRKTVVSTTYEGLAASFVDTYEKWSGSDSPSTPSGSSYVLSGSAGQSYLILAASASEWVETPSLSGGGDWIPAGALQIEINTDERGSLTGLVRVRIRASAGTVKARLYDLTNSVVAGVMSGTVSSTDYEDAVFAVDLTAGTATYELQLSPSIINTPVNGVGYLK